MNEVTLTVFKFVSVSRTVAGKIPQHAKRVGSNDFKAPLISRKEKNNLWTVNGFILSLSHKILELPFCKKFASLLYRLHMFFQVSFQDRVLVSLFYQSKLLFSKDSTSIVPHLYIIAVNGELICP